MTTEAKRIAFSDISITELQEPGRAAVVKVLDFDTLKVIGKSDMLLDERNEITVVIDYPLTKPCKLYISGGPITAERFCKAVSDMYHVIYKEEDRTSPEPAGLVPGMLNRSTTSGKYGVWGHGIGDLVLEAAERSNGVWRIMVGS